MAARWNRPLARGMAISEATFPPPPDSPKIITVRGSPPKRSMFSLTQVSAAAMSSTPALPEVAKRGPSRSPR